MTERNKSKGQIAVDHKKMGDNEEAEGRKGNKVIFCDDGHVLIIVL